MILYVELSKLSINRMENVRIIVGGFERMLYEWDFSPCSVWDII